MDGSGSIFYGVRTTSISIDQAASCHNMTYAYSYIPTLILIQRTVKRKAKLQTRNPRNVLSIPQYIPLKPDAFSSNMGLLNIGTLATKTFSINDNKGENLVETWHTSDSEAVLVETCPPNYNFFDS